MPKIILSPSLLSADFFRLAEQAAELKRCGADTLHVDVMDGRFVPNITIGQEMVKSLDRSVPMPMDVHLMIHKPERFLQEYNLKNVNSITVHPEATVHLDRALQQIREMGKPAGVALNPSTPLSAVEWVLDKVDLVMIMTVNPGFGGQKFIEAQLPKIERARKMIDAAGRGIILAVDGGVTDRNAKAVTAAGANYLVSGSYILGGGKTIEQAIKDLFSAIEN